MSAIKILSSGLQNQIAAGEVVERPASVVKELMENSLDAGAASIQVYLENGGQNLIEIIDDGFGLTPDDLPLALTRHATSKISSMEELSRISSFGFRGEALPSIASISRMTISSCPAGENEGFYLKLSFGELTEQGPAAMTPGTRVKVENLLANVPARLKFLKTRATENKKCIEAFIRHCLACLDTDFELFSESRSQYRFFANQSLRRRLEVIWPEQVCENLQEFSEQHMGISIHGLASNPQSTQARADRLLFYVNRRPVNDRMLLSAVRQAYKGRLLSREYPQAVVFIDLPPEEVDVNVHPAKNEVRFRNEKEVFPLVVRALRPCVQTNVYQSAQLDPISNKFPEKVHENISSYESTEQENLFTRLREKQSGLEFTQTPKESFLERMNAPPRNQPISTRGLTYLGQMEKSYLLFLKNDSTLLIVDRHAAHERVMLEKIKTGFNKTVIKRLVLPEKMALHASELELIQTIWKELKDMGFILEINPDNQLLVSGIPDFFSPREAIQSLKDILTQKIMNLDQIFIAMSCRTAIKSGTSLTPDEAAGLMEKLLACENNQFCPHGRPISRQLDHNELQKMFKRK
ncbi:MAG: DNA mismatch repair endonuclease MutL [Desulfonatronovibrio sp.]